MKELSCHAIRSSLVQMFTRRVIEEENEVSYPLDSRKQDGRSTKRCNAAYKQNSRRHQIVFPENSAPNRKFKEEDKMGVKTREREEERQERVWERVTRQWGVSFKAWRRKHKIRIIGSLITFSRTPASRFFSRSKKKNIPPGLSVWVERRGPRDLILYYFHLVASAELFSPKELDERGGRCRAST